MSTRSKSTARPAGAKAKASKVSGKPRKAKASKAVAAKPRKAKASKAAAAKPRKAKASKPSSTRASSAASEGARDAASAALEVGKAFVGAATDGAGARAAEPDPAPSSTKVAATPVAAAFRSAAAQAAEELGEADDEVDAEAAQPATPGAFATVAARLGSLVSALFGRKAHAAPVQDATRLLESDHAKVKALFHQNRDLPEDAGADRATIYAQIRDELTVHAAIEEELFYPAMAALDGDDPTRMVAEANEEHALVKQLIEELDDLRQDDLAFRAKLKVLEDLVLHHAAEEEKEMFRSCRDRMPEDRRRDLGAELATRKQELRLEREGEVADEVGGDGRAPADAPDGDVRAPN